MKKMSIMQAVLCGLVIAAQSNTFGQEPNNGKGAEKPPTVKAKANVSDPAEEQRRITAVGLLTSLADDAKNFSDHKLRARVLSQSADALWDDDQPRAETLFRRAWTEATISDEDAQKQANEALATQRQRGGPMVRRGRPDVRREVLRLAARRSKALGEELLRNLEEGQKQDTAAASNPRANAMDAWMSSVSDQKRLELAGSFLQNNEIDLALVWADPALTRVTIQSIYFLSDLRRKNAAAADQRFAGLLQIAANDPTSDANTASGLSSYVFTPFLYMNFSKDGGVFSSQRERNSPAPDISPKLRDAFMRTAAQILLRPLLPADQDTTTAGRMGKYMAIKRLLPMFERYLPDAYAELNSTLAALTSDVPGGNRTAGGPEDNGALTRGLIPDDPNKDVLSRMQERLDKAKDSAERDSIYTEYALAASQKKDPRARDLADKIENTETRKQVRGFVDFDYLRRLLDGDDGDPIEAIKVAAASQLTHYQKAWAYTQAARLLSGGNKARTDRVRAAEVLQEALAEARRIGDGEQFDTANSDRARIFVAIASRYADLDQTRAWEMMNEVVKMSNAAPDYTGDDSQMSSMLHTQNMTMMFSTTVEDFDLAGLFKTLAKNDLNRAIDSARNLSAESTRSAATIAIARSVLIKKA